MGKHGHVNSSVKGKRFQNEGRRRTTVHLTQGTTEERLDFVSVLQPVPHTGKHFQRGCFTASETTQEIDKGMDADGGGGWGGAREERGERGRKRQREGRQE